MENEFIKIFNSFKSHIESGMGMDIQAFWEGRKGIQDYEIKVGENEVVIINVKLCNYSNLSARKVFLEFINFVRYDGINLFICYDIKNKTKYLYLTALQDLSGIKMNITIS